MPKLQGRYELYLIAYDDHQRPSYTPIGEPMRSLETARAAAKELDRQGERWEIVETMRRLVEWNDRVPGKQLSRVSTDEG